MEMARAATPKVENNKAYVRWLAGGFSLLPEALESAETVSFELAGRLPDITDGGSNEQTTPSGRFEHDRATEVCVPAQFVAVTVDVLKVPFFTFNRAGEASRLRLAEGAEQCGE
jgi:hypothetical protein